MNMYTGILGTSPKIALGHLLGSQAIIRLKADGWCCPTSTSKLHHDKKKTAAVVKIMLPITILNFHYCALILLMHFLGRGLQHCPISTGQVC